MKVLLSLEHQCLAYICANKFMYVLIDDVCNIIWRRSSELLLAAVTNLKRLKCHQLILAIHAFLCAHSWILLSQETQSQWGLFCSNSKLSTEILYQTKYVKIPRQSSMPTPKCRNAMGSERFMRIWTLASSGEIKMQEELEWQMDSLFTQYNHLDFIHNAWNKCYCSLVLTMIMMVMFATTCFNFSLFLKGQEPATCGN